MSHKCGTCKSVLCKACLITNFASLVIQMRFQCKVSYYQKDRVESSRLWHQQQLSHPMADAFSASDRFSSKSYTVDVFQMTSQASQTASDAVDDLLSKRTGSLSILNTSSGSGDILTSSALHSFQSKGDLAWESRTQWLDPIAVTAATSISNSGANLQESVPTISVPANRLEGSSKTVADVVRSGTDPKNNTASQAGMNYLRRLARTCMNGAPCHFLLKSRCFLII